MTPAVFAQTPGVNDLLNVLRGIFFGIQAVIYIVIALGWLTGLMMWSAPTHSVIIKRSGQQQMELAGLSLFLALIGPLIFTLIITVAQTIIGG